jgi:hypothetical protein
MNSMERSQVGKVSLLPLFRFFVVSIFRTGNSGSKLTFPTCDLSMLFLVITLNLQGSPETDHWSPFNYRLAFFSQLRRGAGESSRLPDKSSANGVVMRLFVTDISGATSGAQPASRNDPVVPRVRSTTG